MKKKFLTLGLFLIFLSGTSLMKANNDGIGCDVVIGGACCVYFYTSCDEIALACGNTAQELISWAIAIDQAICGR